jgi:hypothetical protein
MLREAAITLPLSFLTAIAIASRSGLTSFVAISLKSVRSCYWTTGAFHKAAGLKVPCNISLLFLPPYCPELNPAEMIWRWIKTKLGNKVYASLDVLSKALGGIVKALSLSNLSPDG